MKHTQSPTLSIQESYTLLTGLATQLNQASDRFNVLICTFEQHLHDLRLGVSVWLTIASGNTWKSEVGYSKISGKKWRLVLRHTDSDTEAYTWPFTEGPRHMKLDAVPHLPELLETMVAQAQAMLILTDTRLIDVDGYNLCISALKSHVDIHTTVTAG